MEFNGGLAEVTMTKVDDHRIAVGIGRHRVFDIVDGVAEHNRLSDSLLWSQTSFLSDLVVTRCI